MKAVHLGNEAGIENIAFTDVTDPGQPGKGEIRVRIHNISLNFHDYNVAAGILPAQAGRILMSDGAGIVESIGEDVKDFRPGDAVVSTFFPDWDKGECPLAGFSRTPGDGIDGYAAEYVVRPARFFTHSPAVYHNALIVRTAKTGWRRF